MTTFTLFGNNSGFFGDGFINNDGESNADILFADATTIILNNPDTGITTTINGTGFAFAGPDGEEQPVSGTITGLSMFSSNNTVLEGTITGGNFNIVAFANALDGVTADNFQPFANLLNTNGPITVDGSNAPNGLDMFRLLPPELAQLITQPITVTGGPGYDQIYGGAGDDTILFGGNADFEGGLLDASFGNDTIDFSNATPFDGPWFSYSELIDGAVTINIDSVTNISSVVGVGFTDTLVDIRQIMEADGIGIGASEENDTFNVVVGEGSWINLSGAQGDDTFNLTLHDNARISFSSAHDFFGSRELPSSGANVNLSTGIVSNDGFGGQDTINILGGDGRLEVRGTDLNDTFLGSDRNESFITDEGNDTVNGGDGIDRVRYDRSDVEVVNVDLAAETATATWITGFSEINGVFGPETEDFTDTLISIEEVRGSREGNDTLKGNDDDNVFRAFAGDDLLQGFDGVDELYGGDGDDTLDPGDNDDYDLVDPGAGNDEVLAGSVVNGFLDVRHRDLAELTEQIITVDMSTVTAQNGVVATIDKGIYGTTSVLFADVALTADGMSFLGGDLADSFNLTLDNSAWVSVRGGRGDDTYNVSTVDGIDYAGLRLDFRQSNTGDDATQGLNINLASGAVTNDGFGGQDVINFGEDAVSKIDLEIRGTGNADIIIGSSSDDRFITQGGNDTVDGGLGQDLIRFDRDGIDAGVQVDLGAGTASGIWDGVAFDLDLTSIEEVRGTKEFNDVLIGSGANEEFEGRGGDDIIFADGASAAYYGSTIANQVYRLYQATLDRTPDAGGHLNWTTRIATEERTLLEVADSFVRSPQFKASFSDDLSNTDFVTLLYANVLARAPDDAGLARWVGELDGGASKASVVLGFSQSPQFQASTDAAANTYANNNLTTTWSDDVFRLYQATLDRTPDVNGQNRWSNELADGTSTLLDVADGFVRSPQFKATFSDDLSNTDFVTLLYANVLGRAPDDAGLTRWVGELDGGASKASVVLGFSQSPQFQAETAANLKDWIREQGPHDYVLGQEGENLVAGGEYADVFVFEAGEAGSTTVVDFEAWDWLELDGFDYGTLADAKAHMTQVGADVVFADQEVEFTLKNTDLADIQIDTFLDTFTIA